LSSSDGFRRGVETYRGDYQSAEILLLRSSLCLAFATSPGSESLREYRRLSRSKQSKLIIWVFADAFLQHIGARNETRGLALSPGGARFTRGAHRQARLLYATSRWVEGWTDPICVDSTPIDLCLRCFQGRSSVATRVRFQKCILCSIAMGRTSDQVYVTSGAVPTISTFGQNAAEAGRFICSTRILGLRASVRAQTGCASSSRRAKQNTQFGRAMAPGGAGHGAAIDQTFNSPAKKPRACTPTLAASLLRCQERSAAIF